MHVASLYAEIGIALPGQGGANRAVSCFANREAHAHDDRSASCSVSIESGAFNCHGCGARGGAYDAAISRGKSPREAMDLLRRHGLVSDDGTARVAPPQRKADPLPTVAQIDAWTVALLGRPDLLERLRLLKGWTPEAVVALDVGWDGERLTFPIRDAAGHLVNVSRYRPGGKPKMMALTGRPRNLYPAPELLSEQTVTIHGEVVPLIERVPVYLVEGEPDVVSAHSAGEYGIAVPGANAWRSEWAPRFAGMTVRVLTDHDTQGRQLAERVTLDLAGTAKSVTVLDWAAILGADPPAGFDFGDYAASTATDREVAA